MDSKNYTQVLIDGKIYTLGGSEDEGYLQKTASYVNEKNNVLCKIPGFSKQNVEYRTAMVELNLADDYFKALEHSSEVERQRDDMEREMYSLKHELVSTQMKLEVVLKDLGDRQRELEELTREKNRLDRKVKSMKKAQPEIAEPAGTIQASDAGTGRVSYRVKRAARPKLIGNTPETSPGSQADGIEPEPAPIIKAEAPEQVAVTMEIEAEVTEVLTQPAEVGGNGGEAAETVSGGEVPEAAEGGKVSEAASGREVPETAEGGEVPEAAEGGKAPEAAEGKEAPEEIKQQQEPAEFSDSAIRETSDGYVPETAHKETVHRESDQQLSKKALHAAMAARKRKKR